MKIGLIGSRRYTNSRRIKEFIYKLKEKFGEDITIVSGGQQYGADGYAKKFALEFDMKYVEFPPRHYAYNQHCICEATEYNRAYRIWNYNDRNKQIAEYSDKIVAFIPNGIESKGTMNTIGHAKKLEKKTIIIN